MSQPLLPAKRNRADINLRQIEDAASQGLTPAQVAVALGLSYSEVYAALISGGDEVRQAIDRGYLSKHKLFLSVLEEKALSGEKDSTGAAIFLVKHYEKLHQNIALGGGGKIMQSMFAPVTVTELPVEPDIKALVIDDFESRNAD